MVVSPSGPYTPDVTSQGDPSAGVSSISSANIEKILKENGVDAKKNPYMEFYFLVTYIIGQKEMGNSEQNINKYSLQLSQMSKYLNLAESIKQEFYSCSSSDNSAKTRGAVQSLLNSVLGTFFKNNPGFAPFNGAAGSGALNQDEFTSILNLIQQKQSSNDQAFFTKNFPVLGMNVVGALQNINSLGKYIFAQPGEMPADIHDLWKDAQSGTEYGLPDPIELQPCIDALSEESSTMSGVSAAESSKLQYAMGQFNRLEAYLHDMMNKWLMQRKDFLKAMSGARS